jgi:hypothetical protein
MSPKSLCRTAQHALVLPLSVLLLASTLLACSGGDAAAPGPVTRTVVSETYTMESAPFGAVVLRFKDVVIPGGGEVEVRLDWVNPTSNLDLLVTEASCDEPSLLENRCALLGSDRTLAKPARVRFMQRASGTIRVWIVSFSNVEESGTLTVLLTS